MSGTLREDLRTFVFLTEAYVVRKYQANNVCIFMSKAVTQAHHHVSLHKHFISYFV
jgi:hypothetical protein